MGHRPAVPLRAMDARSSAAAWWRGPTAGFGRQARARVPRSRHYPGHLFALGYGGNGMTDCSLPPPLLLGWFPGVWSGDDRLFGFGPPRWTPPPPAGGRAARPGPPRAR